MKKVILFAIIIFFAFTGFGQTAEEYFQRGVTKLYIKNDFGFIISDSNDYKEAILDFSKAIELNPNYHEAYLQRGISRQELEKTQKNYFDSINWNVGISDYTTAISLKPDYKDAYLKRGETKELLGDYNGAFLDYHKIIEIDSNEASGIQYITVLINNYFDDDTLLLSYYNKWVRIAGNSYSYNERASVKNRLGDYKGAIEDYSTAIRYNNKDKQIFYHRANVKYKLEDFRGAIIDYTSAIQLDAKFANAYFQRGNSKFMLQNYNGAILDYNKVIEIGNVIIEKLHFGGTRSTTVFFDNCLLYINRGKAKLMLNNKNGACLDWSKAGEFDCGEEDVYALIKEYCN